MSANQKKLRDKGRDGESRYSSLLDVIVGCGDMVLLDPPNEDKVVENLKLRYSKKDIYTYIGKVVISINPYEKLTIYTDDYVAQYRSRNMFELPPHIFAIADDAYRSLRDHNEDQCIIITGESGAGKTEASKLIMNYVTKVSTNYKGVERVKEQLLQSNPVLEAFGNAKTIRNDNSSRFGKYMDIAFDFRGDPLGGVIHNYLLEKSRVVFQAPAERNFHIFYQLLAGATDDVLQMLRLDRDFYKFHYLKQSGCGHVLTKNDQRDFQLTVKGMEITGFTPDEISGIFELLSGILNLGNIQFKGYTLPNSTDASKLKRVDEESITYACDMLGCPIKLLEESLTQRTVEAGKETVKKPLSHGQAVYGRDALAKAIYHRLFAWIVDKINETIKVTYEGKKKVIGVLDIYGFEVFQTNSFEQLIINYCNEKLQQVFIELTLNSEQDEYIREGIEWVTIEYFNNEVICSVIENPKNGILALLDEDCLRPGDVSDKTYLQKLDKHWVGHQHYESRGCKEFRSDQTLKDKFRLVHYAGKVSYQVDGFIDKNKDLLYRDLSQLMFNCERKLLKQFFPEGDPEKVTMKRPITTGSQFKTSVAALMKNLLTKNPNYIRCIKPNDEKTAKNFNQALVTHQVRYLGLVENLKVCRAGYAHRMPFERFLLRYKMLSKATWPTWKKTPKQGCKEILKATLKKPTEYSFGRTKVFIRNPTTVFDLEDRRRASLQDLAVLIQKNYKGWHQRSLFQKLRNAQITISKHFRGFKQRKIYQRIRNAQITISKYFKGWQARRELWRMKLSKNAGWASEVIRKYYYAWKLRYTVKRIWAASVIAKYHAGWKVRKQYRVQLKKHAAPVIVRFFEAVNVYMFLIRLRDNLPSQSLHDKQWPEAPERFKNTSMELKKIHHRWRCKCVRDRYNADPKLKRKLIEKTRASILFRGKKALYSKTVKLPFRADRLNLKENPKWLKIIADMSDKRIVWSDNIHKINRATGKAVPKLIAIMRSSVLLLEPRSFAIQYRITLTHIQQVSLSIHNDFLFVLHIDPGQVAVGSYSKGDFIFHCPNVIELVTKLHLTMQEAHSRRLPLKFVDNEIVIHPMPNEALRLEFRRITEEGDTYSPHCKRRGNVMQVQI